MRPPRTINYTNTGWGHNHYFKPQDNGTYYGPCWVGSGIIPGDTVVWKTNYGQAEALVLEVDPCFDPPDMYYVRSRVTKRIADPNIVSQEEIDEFFKDD